MTTKLSKETRRRVWLHTLALTAAILVGYLVIDLVFRSDRGIEEWLMGTGVALGVAYTIASTRARQAAGDSSIGALTSDDAPADDQAKQDQSPPRHS